MPHQPPVIPHAYVAKAAPSRVLDSRGHGRGAGFIALIVIVLALLAVAFFLVTFITPNRFRAASGGGTLEVDALGIKFRNLDGATILSDAGIGETTIVRLGGDIADARKGWKIIQITGRPRQWVFVWHGTNQSGVVQGLPLSSELPPAFILPGRSN